MPGLVDTHIHSSQYPNSGLGLDLPLLQWLDTYTFPLESKYKDVEFAENVYRKVVVWNQYGFNFFTSYLFPPKIIIDIVGKDIKFWNNNGFIFHHNSQRVFHYYGWFSGSLWPTSFDWKGLHGLFHSRLLHWVNGRVFGVHNWICERNHWPES